MLHDNGHNSLRYTENASQLGAWIPATDVLYLCNNKPIGENTRKAIFNKIDQHKLNLLIYHPSAWYNWLDWPEYNRELVGGGSTSHEKLQAFEVHVVNKKHKIMKGVPSKFKIVDELYRWKKDPKGKLVNGKIKF